MANRQQTNVLRHVYRIAAAEVEDHRPDATLLEAFTVQHDDRAFEALLRRHARMVWGVCKRYLDNDADAEDSFQATFLVFARKAGSIRKTACLVSWLHGVAYRVVMRARRNLSRRRDHERRAATMPRSNGYSEMDWREVQALIDQEVQLLPESYRAPFVLCCLEGESIASAARRLGCKEGTVASRLARARQRLKTRLTRRGVSLTAILTAAAIAPNAKAVPPALVKATMSASMGDAAGHLGGTGGVSANVLALTEGVCKKMTPFKLTIGTALLLAVSVAGGLGLLMSSAFAQRRESEKQTQTKEAPAARASERGAIDKALVAGIEEPMIVKGQVQSADGKPVPNAVVTVLQWHNRGHTPRAIGSGKADGSGKFVLKLRRPGAARWDFGLEFVAVASAAGHGLTWKTLEAETPEPYTRSRRSATQQEVKLQLTRERPVQGRLIDLQGKPIAGARVHVVRVGNAAKHRTLIEFQEPPRDIDGCPRSVVTDKKGGFILRSLGDDLTIVRVQVVDDRLARQVADFKPREKGPKELRMFVEPARIVEGVVTRGDPNKPVQGARVVARSASGNPLRAYVEHGEAVTDKAGRYRLHAPALDSFELLAWPGALDPSLGFAQWVKWPRGAVKQRADFVLKSGAIVRGKVTEAGTGKPVAGATIGYHRYNRNRQADALLDRERGNDVCGQPVVTGPDGTFQMAVLPGEKMSLLVRGPTRDYIEVVTARGKIENFDLASRFYAHAVVTLDNPRAGKTRDLQIKLRRGVTLKGTLLDPKGRVVEEAQMLSCMTLKPLSATYSPYIARGWPVTVRGGQFSMHGCDPDKSYDVFFLDVKNKLAAATKLSGKGAKGKPVRVRLEPCGSATLQMRDFAERPVRLEGGVDLMITPGTFRLADSLSGTGRSEVFERGGVWADEIDIRFVVGPRGKWGESVQHDGKGNYTLKYLIPGATYRLAYFTRSGFKFRQFTVKPGENLKMQVVISEKEVRE
jgi:RNA polymerase sigma factor (sigma-70 family)